MGEIYKTNRDGGIRKSLGEYGKLIPICGGCFASGIAYFGGTIGGMIKYAGSQIPYLLKADNIYDSIWDKAGDIASNMLHSGYDTGAKLAPLGFFAGLFLTVKFKNMIKDFFGK